MLEDGAHAFTVTNVKPHWPMSPGRRERRVAQWNLTDRAPENHNPRMKTTSPPITSFSGECPVTASPRGGVESNRQQGRQPVTKVKPIK